jgi:hypothetical protein
MSQIPNTKTVVSYSYSIFANGKRIGTLQDFSPDQTRTLERIREIANDNIAEDTFEILPGRRDITITATRFELYSTNFLDALGYELANGDLASIRDPLEVREQWRGPDGKVRSVVYSGCWISRLGKTVREGTSSVTESVTLSVTRVIGGQPA